MHQFVTARATQAAERGFCTPGLSLYPTSHDMMNFECNEHWMNYFHSEKQSLDLAEEVPYRCNDAPELVHSASRCMTDREERSDVSC